MIYDHYDDIPLDDWPCRFFTPDEIACNGTGQIFINYGALAALDEFRSLIGGSVSLSSAYRSPYHNASVGGAPLSVHTVRGGASAFDIRLQGRDKALIRNVAERVGFTAFGMNYNSFVHIDQGRPREW